MNYVEVLNSSSVKIQFQAFYYKGTVLISKSSKILGIGVIDKIQIPNSTSVTGVRVGTISALGKFKEFFNDSAPGSKQLCYEVVGSSSGVKCNKADCTDINSHDTIYLKNNSPASVRIEAVYYVDGKMFDIDTPKISYSKGLTMYFPHRLENGIFKVSMLEKHTFKDIWHAIYSSKIPPHPFKICYITDGTLTNPKCVKVACKTLEGSDGFDTNPNRPVEYCDCCNKPVRRCNCCRCIKKCIDYRE